MIYPIQSMVKVQRHRRQTIALAWLNAFADDPELVALLADADDDAIDKIFWLITWFDDRGLLRGTDRNGNAVPF